MSNDVLDPKLVKISEFENRSLQSTLVAERSALSLHLQRLRSMKQKTPKASD